MFDSRYIAVLADTQESHRLHHQVRFQVFCRERGFEPAEHFHDQQERDDWDQHAARFVVLNRDSGRAVAAVRIILPDAPQLPVHQLNCLSGSLPAEALSNQVGEASRICVVRSRSEIHPGTGRTPLATWLHKTPIEAVPANRECDILLGMIRATLGYCSDTGIAHFFMLVTRPFSRLLGRLGLDCTCVGEGIEHRGSRAPYLVDVANSWDGMLSRTEATAQLFSRRHLAYCSHAESLPMAGSWRAAINGRLTGRPASRLSA